MLRLLFEAQTVQKRSLKPLSFSLPPPGFSPLVCRGCTSLVPSMPIVLLSGSASGGGGGGGGAALRLRGSEAIWMAGGGMPTRVIVFVADVDSARLERRRVWRSTASWTGVGKVGLCVYW